MHGAERLVTAEYTTVVVGDKLPTHYEPRDVVYLADAITADIVTVGDSRELLPDGEVTDGYLGRLNDQLDAVHAADSFLVVGVDLTTAQQIPWAVFSGDGVVMTTRSVAVYRDAVSELPCDYWIGNADASTLHEFAATVSELATPPAPARVYSERTEHPDPPVDIASTSSSAPRVKQCKVCHTLTNNKVTMGSGFPGPAVEWRCPAVAHRNHERLEALLEQRDQLQRRRTRYGETTDPEQRAQTRVDAEYERVNDQIATLRAWFDERFDDVVSRDPTLSDVPQFEPRALQYE